MSETAYVYSVRLRRELDGLAGGTLSGSVVETEQINADKMEDDGNFFVFWVKVGNDGQFEKIAWFNREEVRWVRKERS